MDRYIGTLLAGCYGDIMGSQTEGKTKKQISQQFQFGLHMPANKLYTDDTEMTLVLARHLTQNKGKVERDALHMEFATNMTNKGYSQQTRNIFTNFKNTGVVGGAAGCSPNNGAVMRIAPLALVSHKDDGELVSEIKNAIFYTHGGSPDALASAYIHCKLISFLLKSEYDFKKKRQFTEDVFGYILNLARQHPPLFCKLNLTYCIYSYTSGVENITEQLTGNPDYFQITAIDALCCAIYSFISFIEQPAAAIIFSSSMGGDTDTIAKITGDLCGALHGTKWIPENWKGSEGEIELAELGKKIFDLNK
jgi:ADP-ribosylglycohydrolase